MSAREALQVPSGSVRIALEAGFVIVVGVVAAALDLSLLASVIVIGLAWIAAALVERAARAAHPRGTRRPPPASDPVFENTRPEPLPVPEPGGPAVRGELSASGEWNLWELERRAREHAGADAVPEEWAAIFMCLRDYAKSDGALPPQFDSLVRESFPELTHAL